MKLFFSVNAGVQLRGGGESLRSLTPRCEEIIQIGPKA